MRLALPAALVAAFGFSWFSVASGCATGSAPAEAICGNAIIDNGEACDDGNADDTDGCTRACKLGSDPLALCGNGTVDDGEGCDDGNDADGDGCSAACQDEGKPPVCGDGALDSGEACDDGNPLAYDGCEPDCTLSPDEIVCTRLPALASGRCEITPGNAGGALFIGDVLLEHTVLVGGEVAVDASGMIVCAACDCSDEAAGAKVVTCPRAVISPALVNSHDHITYTHNAPYTNTGERYEHRHEWRRGKNGHTEIPSKGGASDDAIRWGELRFVMGGATSTVGSGSATGFLRNLDKFEQEGLGQPPVLYDTFPLGDSNALLLAAGCGYPGIVTAAEIADEDAFFPHVAEGINAHARNEFLCMSSTDNGGEDLLTGQSAFIHSIGLAAIDYARMSMDGTTLVWSPRSNVTLYGDTAMVTAAARLGVRIALGTDWMPTGSMNMLRELRCADELNTVYFDGQFSDRELFRMATLSGAEAASVDDVLGKLRAGTVADIAIFDASVRPAHRAVIAAEPEDVVLVVRGGVPLYGDSAVIAALHSAGDTCDLLDVCGTEKRVCSQDETGLTFSELESAAGALYPLFFCTTPDNEPSCLPTRPASVAGSTTYSGATSMSDADGDGIENSNDDCPFVFNPVRPVDQGKQRDTDGDGDGDACDPCPLDPESADCAPLDLTDTDGDGVLDATDGCPLDYDTEQTDGDGDGKGDACDACPDTANPGNGACPFTIYAIKAGETVGPVAVKNALVTGCASGQGIFLQSKLGDPDHKGPENSGVFVFSGAVSCGVTVSPGDRVDIETSLVTNFYGQVQLSQATITVVASLGESMPAPVVVDAAAAGSSDATALEAVLVRIEQVLVTDTAPAPGAGDQAPTNEFVVAGVLRIDDLMHLAAPAPVVSQAFASITGILAYRNGAQKLEPRSALDLVAGPPVLVLLEPAATFARQGKLASPSIPTPLTVTLSLPVEVDTFVAIVSGAPANLVATTTPFGAGVIVPKGQSSATILLDALAVSPSVPLTASLDGVALTAMVRVIGATEAPKVLALEPALATVPPLTTLPMTVLLDIPAPPGAAVIALSTSPGQFGTVPATVAVLADQLSATFNFGASPLEGNELVLASFAMSSATSKISVAETGGLILNELDYDQAGTDNGEFIELLNTKSSSYDLTGHAVVLINGGLNTEYLRIELGPAGVLGPGEYLVIGTPVALALVPMGIKMLPMPKAADNVQNGAPDALGILRTNSMLLVDALSYEGEVTMGSVKGIGALNFVEGTAIAKAIADSNNVTTSFVRLPNGSDTDDAATDWKLTLSITPGAPNLP
ncbi:MAG: DUF4215 domain-containing protein [Myxococcales bacterium]|nr:DUF4215 domain-containing protein [Myxococcales bacterium]